MYDSLSDSDHTISNTNNSTGISEDLQIADENSRNNLQEINDNLTKENSKLKAQFSEAVQCASKFDMMHERITQLSTEINSISFERDDLNRRLEIALRTNDELNQQLQSERIKFCQQKKEDNANYKKQLQSTQETMKKQIDDLYGELEKIKSAKESEDIELKLSVNTIQRILSSASHFFQCTFSKVEDFIQILNQPPPLPKINTDITEQEANANANVNDQPPESKNNEKNRKIKKLKSAIDESNKIRGNLEIEIINLKKEMKQSKFSSDQTIEELNKQIQQINDDHSIVVEDMKHQISILQTKVQTLKDELQKRKEEQKKILLEQSQQTNNFEIPPKPATLKITNELEIANEQMLKRTQDLGKQNKELNEKLQNSDEKIKELQSIIESKDLTIEKLKHDFGSLNLIHQTATDEIQTLRNALHAKKKKNPQEEKEKNHKIHVLKSQVITLKKTNESQLNQIHELSSLNEQLSHTVEEQKSQITKIKLENDSYETRHRDISEELHSLQQEIALKASNEKPAIFPADSWRFNEFDAPLKSEIDRISMSQHLQPPTKLQHIYKIINKYFKEQLMNKEKVCQTAVSENQTMKDVFNQFFVDISIALAQKPCSFEDFFSKDGCKNLTNSILTFRTEFDELRRRFDVYDTVIKHLVETMDFQETQEAPGLITEINELKAKFFTLKNNLAKRKKRISSLKADFNDFRLQTEQNSIEIKGENEHLKETVSSLAKKNKELATTNQELKRQIHHQKLQIEDCNRNQQETENRLYIEKETITKEKVESEGKLSDQIKVLAQRLKSSEEQLMNSEIAMNKLKKVIQNLKNTINEKNEKLDITKTDSEVKINELTTKWETEKQQIIKSYENAILEMKNESEEQRKDVEKLVQDLSEAKRKAKKSKELSKNFKQEKIQLEKAIEDQKLKMQKAKLFVETAAKSQLESAEKDFITKLEASKVRHENDKRKLFAFVADQFRQFFNPQDSLDETTVRAIITRASSELARLVSSDFAIRKMVGAEMQQRTDDAVAQLVTNY